MTRPREPRGATSTEDDARDGRERPYAGRPYLLGTIHPETAEIRELASTLGLELVAEVYQPRDRPHPGTFFGKGKLQSFLEDVTELKAGVVPAGWRWTRGEFQVDTDERDEATAWGGTPWVAGAAEGDEGPEGPGPEVQRDPLVSAGRASGETTGRGDGRRGARHGQGAHPGLPDLATWAKKGYLLVLNEDVRPSVLFNLEERLGVEVWDRTRLILEIFGQHANVKEARLQVELAKLQYEVPLIHEAVHRRRAGERPGFMGGGEYEVADYEDFIKRRMRAVKDELERIRRERDVRRKVRRERFYLVSLAGYTNAGKSSLLNALTGAAVHEKWEMFSTLETTTRRLGEGDLSPRHKEDEAPAPPPDPEGDEEGPPTGTLNRYVRPILLTDTVGFIQALPAWLLDAFRSTLEEISVSDVVLLVVDVSDPIEVLLEKLRVCREELGYLDVTCPVLLVLSKTDLVPREVVEAKRRRLVTANLAREDLLVVASAKDGLGLDDLVDHIHDVLPDMVVYRASLPTGDKGQRLLSLLYGWGEIRSVDYGDRILVSGSCDPLHWKTLVREALDADAEVVRTSR